MSDKEIAALGYVVIALLLCAFGFGFLAGLQNCPVCLP